METTNRYKEVMARLAASKARKKDRVEHLVEVMKEEYELRTGKPANYVNVI